MSTNSSTVPQFPFVSGSRSTRMHFPPHNVCIFKHSIHPPAHFTVLAAWFMRCWWVSLTILRRCDLRNYSNSLASCVVQHFGFSCDKPFSFEELHSYCLSRAMRELDIPRIVEEFSTLESQIRLKFPFSVPGSLVHPETFSIDSLTAYINVFMTTDTLRTSQLFEDWLRYGNAFVPEGP